ncbi:MAG: DNA alkylation repair protein [Eubacteriales bacterium]|nr:DNA alkylation repair protein [Eubacteriales bacterium]
MDRIVKEAITKIQELEKNAPNGKHVVTGDIRKLSSKLFKSINDKSIEHILGLCEELLNQRTWALGVIAYDFAYRVKNQYGESTYDVFFRWLKDYVSGWGDCDDFCTHAFGELLRQDKSLFAKVILWTNDHDFWVRRASAVILIPAIKKNDYNGIEPLEIANRLMLDEHDLVLKGYGWMLKSLSQIDQRCVMEYLIENYERMPRVAYRYALEKFDKETRNKLMKMK